MLAAEHRLTVLYYDADFEIAGEAINVEHRWVVPRGSTEPSHVRAFERPDGGTTARDPRL